MKVAFTGTQDGMTEAQWFATWDTFVALGASWVHHGLCIGSDRQAHKLARHMGCKVKGHPPLNTSKMAVCECDVLGEAKEYIARNHDIVDETAALVATPNGPERLRSGTWSTIRYARKLGRPTYVIMPDGSVTSS